MMLMSVLLVLLTFTSSLALPESPESFLPSIISSRTRLLVVSPHPDDETLGAGGLIQRVLHVGGTVKVAFMTNGDGFPAGVKMVERVSHPLARDFRAYGRQRQTEALKALTVLSVPEKDVIFLGFPDSGLCSLQTQYRKDTGPDFMSPFTLEDRPPAANILVPHVEYNGEDLQRELHRILQRFRPSIVITTHSRDQHPDHSATYLFVKNTLQERWQQQPAFHPVFLTFLIHYEGWWPMLPQTNTKAALHPPLNFPKQEHSWLYFPLSLAEFQGKHQALLHYHSQMFVMQQYLLSFVRSNELFVQESLESKKKPQLSCHR